jgi:hypothetical protein
MSEPESGVSREVLTRDQLAVLQVLRDVYAGAHGRRLGNTGEATLRGVVPEAAGREADLHKQDVLK